MQDVKKGSSTASLLKERCVSVFFFFFFCYGLRSAKRDGRQIDLFRPKLSELDAKALHKAAGPDGRTGFTERINVTFRFYRPDFTPASNSEYPPLPRCKCEGQPLCILRPDMKGRLSPDASTPYVGSSMHVKRGFKSTDARPATSFGNVEVQGRPVGIFRSSTWSVFFQLANIV